MDWERTKVADLENKLMDGWVDGMSGMISMIMISPSVFTCNFSYDFLILCPEADYWAGLGAEWLAA